MFSQNYPSISKLRLRVGFDVKNDSVDSCFLQERGGAGKGVVVISFY